MVKPLTKPLAKHLTHQCQAVPTPDKKNHYAKLVCVQCDGLFLQWLARNEAESLLGPLPKKQQAAKTKTNWTTTTVKERTFYQNYQPTRQRKNSQLIGDRLALRGRNQYNGNPIGSIPLNTLKSILTSKIDNPSDRQFIEKHIIDRSGPYPGSSDISQ